MTTLDVLPSPTELQARFAQIQPLIDRYAPMVSHRLRCPGRREDAVAELTGITWAYFVHLAKKGRDARRFPASLVFRAVQHVRSGRRLCGQEPAKDPLSWRCQTRRGFTVERLPDYAKLNGNAHDEALHDNTRTPVADQVQFRIDWPAFLQTRSERDRALIDRMALGERTLDLADAFGMSPGRISQLRTEYQHAWERFCGDSV